MREDVVQLALDVAFAAQAAVIYTTVPAKDPCAMMVTKRSKRDRQAHPHLPHLCQKAKLKKLERDFIFSGLGVRKGKKGEKHSTHAHAHARLEPL